jgi:hypothetical protein
MKTKLFFLLMFLSSVQLKAQISFEDTLSVGASNASNGLIRFRYAGDKYFSVKDTTSIELYNLNHTLYKSIALPNTSLYGGTSNYLVLYISETLFDNDSSTIEYMLRNYEYDRKYLSFSYAYLR